MPDVFTTSKTNDIDSNGDYQKSERLEKLRSRETEKQLINIPEGTNIHKLPGHTHNPLAPYCFYPDNIKFVNSDADEKMILILRAHPITNLPWLVAAFVMIIAPSFLSVFPFFAALPSGYQTIIILVWYLLTSSFVLEKFLNWFFNVNLITDERIFDVDFVNLMYREITEADLDQVQDVTVEIAGAAGTLFGYGNVLIQTAAEEPRIEFNSIPNPDRVAKILRELGIQEEVEHLEGRIR